MAFEVLASGPRTLHLDPGRGPESWRGDGAAAVRFGQEIRRLQPGPWVQDQDDAGARLHDELPLAELAAFCNGTAVKELWTTFATTDDRKRLSQAGFPAPSEGVTPEGVYEVCSTVLGGLGLPLEFVGDGTTEDPDEFQRFLDACIASESDFAGV
jgi:hypothetical protein